MCLRISDKGVVCRMAFRADQPETRIAARTRVRLTPGIDSARVTANCFQYPARAPLSEIASEAYCPNPDCPNWWARLILAGTIAMNEITARMLYPESLM